MNILIDIGHPAHVHLFKNFAFEMQKRGNEILFTCREKEFEIELLEHYGFNYKSFGKKYYSKSGKLWGMLEFSLKEFIAGLKFKPDLLLSHGSMYAAFASKLLNIPHISFEDTYNMEQVRFYRPFSSIILSGNYEHPALGDKEIKFNGYHELAYLHPNKFTPDVKILDELGVNQNDKYSIIRFIAWNASHDFESSGISFKNKLMAIEEFEKYGKVFISSESVLPTELERYRIKVRPSKMHDVISFASLLFGESSTMAEECAMLGTPAIFIYKGTTYYTRHLEKDYKLLFNFNSSDEDQLNAIEKGIEILNTSNLKSEWIKRRDKMLEDKIDVTTFLVWFVENYPASVRVMKENPEYQYKFK